VRSGATAESWIAVGRQRDRAGRLVDVVDEPRLEDLAADDGPSKVKNVSRSSMGMLTGVGTW
jgi:hypothetical protein